MGAVTADPKPWKLKINGATPLAYGAAAGARTRALAVLQEHIDRARKFRDDLVAHRLLDAQQTIRALPNHELDGHKATVDLDTHTLTLHIWKG